MECSVTLRKPCFASEAGLFHLQQFLVFTDYLGHYDIDENGDSTISPLCPRLLEYQRPIVASVTGDADKCSHEQYRASAEEGRQCFNDVILSLAEPPAE